MDATLRETTIETKVPARLDALGWGRFHTLIIVALGITWILDGLEVTFAGLISGALKKDLGFPTPASTSGRASISPAR